MAKTLEQNQIPRLGLLLPMIFAVLGLLLGTGLFLYSQHRQVLQKAESRLRAVEDYKTAQILAWQASHRDEAKEWSENNALSQQASQWLLAAAQPPNPALLLNTLRSVGRHYHYADVWLVDPQGEVRLHLNSTRPTLSTQSRQVLRRVLESGQPLMTDFEADANGVPCLDSMAPLYPQDCPGSSPVGAIVFRIDARQTLYPLIQNQLESSQSVETLLVRRDGDQVLFLNELRHRTNTALKLRYPLSQTNVPAVMAVLGQTGMVRGYDYRGVEVVSSLRSIPGTTWFMVTKEDAAEALASWTFRAGMILALLVLSLALLALANLVWFQRQAKIQYRSLLTAQAGKRQAEERCRITLKSVGDGVISTDVHGQVDFMNAVAEQLTGWTTPEAVGKPLETVFQIVHETTRKPVVNPASIAMRQGITVGLANHTCLIARDGVERPIADAAAPIKDDSAAIVGTVLIFRDQSKERQAERALRESLASRDLALRSARMGTWAWDIEAAKRSFDEQAAVLLGLDLASFGGSHEEFFARVHPEDREPLMRALTNTIETGAPYEMDYRVRLPGGETRHLSSRARLNRDENGRATRVNGVLWDVTERQLAAEALKESENRFRLLFDKMIDGFALHEIVCDAAGQPVDYRFLSVNPAFEQLTGLKASQVVGRCVREILPQIEPFWIETYGRVALTGNSVTFKRYNQDLGRHFEINVYSPKPRKFACIFTDITDRMQAEEEVRASRKRLLEILQSTPAGYFYIDREGRFRHVNEAWLHMHGFNSPEEAVGLHFSATQTEQDLAAAEDLVTRVLAGEQINSGEFSRRLKDGSTAWHSFTIRPVAKEGQIIGLEGFVIDTTQAKAAERLILRNQAELEAIYDGTPIMMCIVNREGRVERINRAMQEFIHHTVDLTQARGPGDVMGCVNAMDHPKGCGFSPQCLTCPLRVAIMETFATGSPRRQIRSQMFLAGVPAHREIFVQATTSLIQVQGEAKVVLCLQDCTEQRLLESQLLQAQKMEAVGQLAGGVAHDFNNILAATILQIQLLKAGSPLTEEMREGLGELEQGAQRAASLTRQLLLFSRRNVMQSTFLELNQLLADEVKMLRRLLGERIAFTFVPATEALWILADPGMIEQIVMNLCVNSRDAMPQGGKLQLTTARNEVTPEQLPNHPQGRMGTFAAMQVTDEGCGMSEATLKRIFEPFFTTKEPGKGTGLGLATVYAIVNQHQGWIEVASTVGQGTAFTIFLPLSKNTGQSQDPSAEPPPRLGTETILLVEDDDIIRIQVGKVLRGQGYQVIEAMNGVQAMARFKESGEGVDLLVSDMIMPGGLSGASLARQLRALNPDLKVILISGYSPESLHPEIGPDENVHFLPKPFDLIGLNKALWLCLEGKSNHGRQV